ncbi:uncharacterized protein LOC108677978 isoform X2 [Hyalella azteca]|uniref:Uncharacterized protein LOC108677978 isoform X2 n=1 Tax=Hyalella azteca TaxID=294128 RepID=A0A8B7P7G2_HYAAZ|nr:uncharacterized protein LOC108677978 isoform X2 [Hyalella azteca]
MYGDVRFWRCKALFSLKILLILNLCALLLISIIGRALPWHPLKITVETNRTWHRPLIKHDFIDEHVRHRIPLNVSDECRLPWWDGGLTCRSGDEHTVYFTNETRSYCSLRAHRLGSGQKVISYCLFGDYEEYASGFDEILSTIRYLYPGWVVRLYTNPRGYKQALLPLLTKYSNLYICDARNLPGRTRELVDVDPRLWRVAVLGDELVDVFLVRDIDSVLLEREVHAVKEWLESGQYLHVMRDHPEHGVPILAGTFGVAQNSAVLPLLNSIRDRIFNRRLPIPNDQAVLNKSVVHDSFTCAKYPGSVPFPTQRKDGQFVGNRRYRANFSNEALRKKCPRFCRPHDHPDWEYC